ncbi:MAG TPA: hypothetical protein VFK05_28150 [Polyangiaceae bacterium]|nr:hypothetical protein [Polyangiaceae bacterium]
MNSSAGAASPRTAPGREIVIVALLVALAVGALGWWTHVRSVMYGALLFFLAGALLPFLVLVVVLALLSIAAFVAALSGGDLHVAAPEASGVAEAWTRFTSGYYRLLAKQRGPWFWGVALGFVIGTLALWAALAVWVVPGETRTMKILASARDDIERAQRESGKYPAPDADGHYVQQGNVVLDGFGQPLHYRVEGRWKLASYVLVSWGFDARPSDDDLCVQGGGKLLGVSRAAEALARLLEGNPDSASFSERLSSVRAARCSGSQIEPHKE